MSRYMMAITLPMLACLWAMGCISSQAHADDVLVVAESGQPRIYFLFDESQFASWAATEGPTINSDASGAGLGSSIADFLRYFQEMTGSPLSTKPIANAVPLTLSHDRGLLDELGRRGVRIEVTQQGITLRAASRLGLLNGLYTLLDYWGCRWPKAGKFGEAIPTRKDLMLPLGIMQYKPASDSVVGMRTYWGNANNNAQWVRRNRMGYDQWFSAQHFWSYAVPPETYFEKHPEYYALIGGKRTPSQLCTTNPEVIQLVIENAKQRFRNDPTAISYPMDPNDNIDFCQCANCKAIDPPGLFRGLPKHADRVVTFANAVAQGIEDEFPDKVVAFYAYWSHQLPPERVKPRHNVVVQVTRMGYTYVQLHEGSNYQGPDRTEDFEQMLDAWMNMVESYVYTFEYNTIYWTGQLPCPIYLAHARVAKRHHAKGVRGRHEDSSDPSTPTNFLNHYLPLRMLANPDLDPVQELRETCEVMFGPAGQAMFDYYMILAEVEQYDSLVSGGVVGYERMFTPDMMKRARASMDLAIQQVQGQSTIFQDRVKLIEMTFQYLDHFVSGIWAAQKGNHDAFISHFDAVDRLIQAINTMDYLPMSEAPRRLTRARLVAQARYFPEKLGFAQSWLVLGPFNNDKRDAIMLHDAFETQPRFEPAARLTTQAGQSAKWKLYRSPEGFVSFEKAFHDTSREWEMNYAYATTRIVSDKPRRVQFRMDSFNAFRVYLNGQQIYERQGLDEDEPDKRIVAVDLKQGANTVLIKVSQTTPEGIEGLLSGWGFYFRITAEDGQLIPELRYTP